MRAPQLLAALRRVPGAACCQGVAGPAAPRCCCRAQARWVAAAASFASTAQPQQLVTLRQPPGEDGGGGGGRRGSAWLLWGGAAAAAAGAAAGWAAWSDGGAARRSAAALERRGALGGALSTSPAAQAAVAVCAGGPLVALLGGAPPGGAALAALPDALAAEAGALAPWELVDALWGLALLGVPLSPRALEALAGAALAQLSCLSLYRAIVSAWAITLLAAADSGGGAAAAGAARLADAAWAGLLARLAGVRAEELDEAAVLYLLHAAAQRAAAALGAAPAAQPRPSRGEVLAQLPGVDRRLAAAVSAAYTEYVPFAPHVEGGLMPLLHTAKALQAHVAAAAASGGGGGGGGPYVRAFRGLNRTDADAAAALVSDRGGTLGKLRRSLSIGWRSGELLDRHQRLVNQVAFVLGRRLSLQVAQPADVDVLLPTLRTALLLVDDGRPQAQPQQAPSVDAQLDACHGALLALVRSRFAPPPGGFAARLAPGLAAAKERSLAQRGWCVVRLGMGEVEACAGAPRPPPGQRRGSAAAALPDRDAALAALLRARLA
ncbi:hypothetical protein HT031_006203 [Scenedesmus sp. PABB004]|nr:hypothetical protein HT031_006203 [Scenedesmus sp. PABB004]